MKITLESTTKIVELVSRDPDWPHARVSMPARIWEGTTERGVQVIALITRITPGPDERAEEFERDLMEQRTPSGAAEAIPARLIL